jgi:hypothetical protein
MTIDGVRDGCAGTPLRAASIAQSTRLLLSSDLVAHCDSLVAKGASGPVVLAFLPEV